MLFFQVPDDFKINVHLISLQRNKNMHGCYKLHIYVAFMYLESFEMWCWRRMVRPFI
jgi:hypothetical protein